MEYTPITEEKKPEFIEWLTNMSEDVKGLPEQPQVRNIFPGSENGDVITIKDMIGNFIATLSGKNFIIPALLFMVMLFGSCTSRPQYTSQPFYNDQGQQVMYVDRGDGTSFLMDYMLYSTLFRQGGYNSINSYYNSHPSQFINRSAYSNYYPKSNGILNKTVSASSYTSPSRSSSSSYSSPSRSSSSSYSSPSRSYSSPNRSSSSYSSPSRSYSSPSRSYSSPSRSYSSPSRSYSSPGRR